MREDWYPGIQEFCSYWSHAPMLQQTFETLERSFEGENDACIDAAKSIIECACQVLIQELDDPSNPIREWPDTPLRSNPSCNNYISAALKLLRLSSSRQDPINKLISQHFNLTDELSRLRDASGPVSHGKEGFVDRLSAHHRRSALLAADAIVTFLHRAFLEREPDPVRSIQPYERFAASSEQIDKHCAVVRIEEDEGGVALIVAIGPDERVSLNAKPSELLFAFDREAYKSARNLTAELPDPVSEEDEAA